MSTTLTILWTHCPKWNYAPLPVTKKKDQQAVFTAGISVLIKNLIEAAGAKSISKGSALSNSSFSNTATQTDPYEDSDTEWFDAEDTAPDD